MSSFTWKIAQRWLARLSKDVFALRRKQLMNSVLGAGNRIGLFGVEKSSEMTGLELSKDGLKQKKLMNSWLGAEN
jgi:hypothetical protein